MNVCRFPSACLQGDDARHLKTICLHESHLCLLFFLSFFLVALFSQTYFFPAYYAYSIARTIGAWFSQITVSSVWHRSALFKPLDVWSTYAPVIMLHFTFFRAKLI